MYKRNINLMDLPTSYERPFDPNIPVPKRVKKTDKEIVAAVVKKMKGTLPLLSRRVNTTVK